MKCCPLCGTEAADHVDICLKQSCQRPFQSWHEKAAAKHRAQQAAGPTRPTSVSLTSSDIASSRAGHFAMGVGLTLLAAVALSLPIIATEEEFLGARVRRGGIIKLIEQSIGWEAFVVLIVLFALGMLRLGIISFWKAVNDKPDLLASPERLEFHPSLRRFSASYDDIESWSIQTANGFSLRLRFLSPHWSLQNIFGRRVIKIAADRRCLVLVAEYFDRHPVMSEKYTAR